MRRVARLSIGIRPASTSSSLARGLVFGQSAALPIAGPRRSAQLTQTRSLFSFLRRSPKPKSTSNAAAPAPLLLSQDDLFHPLSQSPFPALVDKANRIKSVSLCPTSFEKHSERIRPAFDCPDCGWPTHATQERWQEGREEHKEYCGRLREVNEDEHDIRSGRKMSEFENMPEGQSYEAAVNFTSWDTYFFTRDFPSIDSDRAIRHVSKVLTYPMSIASVLHQNGPFTSGNSRITTEGRRSMAAIHSVLHLPPGSSIEESQTTPLDTKPNPPFRIFLLGARAESTLPPELWQQLTFLFPRTTFHIYFIGPEVGLPLIDKNSPRRKHNYFLSEDRGWGFPSYTLNQSPQLTLTSLKAGYEQIHDQLGPFDPYNDVFFAFSPGLGFPHQPGFTSPPSDAKSSDAKADGSGAAALSATEGSATLDRAEAVPASQTGSTAAGAAAAYSLPEAEETAPISSASPADVASESEPESAALVSTETETETEDMPTQPLVQAQTTWATPLRQILTTKCPLFFTAFSPLDLERDVSALYSTTPPTAPPIGEFPEYVNLPTRPVGRIHGVTDEFELILTPGRNLFGSEKWEIAEWDVRVGVKTNWGIWGIRGKKYEVVDGEARSDI